MNLIGIPVFASGAWLAVAARRRFVAKQTPVPFSDRTNHLHTGGAFRYTRNPMYLGITIGLSGFALVFSSFFNFLFPLLFLLLMDRFFVPREETALSTQFGNEYLEFKKKVRRWL